MITGLRGATIWSEDLNNLLPFYRDLLNLPIAVQIPGTMALTVIRYGAHSRATVRVQANTAPLLAA